MKAILLTMVSLSVLFLSGCQLGVESKVTKPESHPFYEWRYDPYTGQPIR